MLLFYHSWVFYNHFIATLYHFLGLTYWPSASASYCFLLVFLHRRKSISNGVKIPRNFLWNFYGTEDIQWARSGPGGAPSGAEPTRAHLGAQARLGGLCPPWGTTQVLLWPTGCLLVRKKIHKKFHGVWTPFDIDFLRCKKQAKNSNWH